LKDLGADIYQYPAHDIISNYYSKSLFNKILFRTKIKTGYKSVNKQLLIVAEEYKPDVIWIFKGMEIFPSTLRLLREKYKIANYNPDHPFIIANRASGNKNVVNSVGLYHLHFCYHSQLQTKIETEFGIPTVFLPFAYDTTDLVYTNQREVEEINRVCFQANPDSYRVEKVQFLTDNGIEVDVYGHGWYKTHLKNNNKVTIFPIASRSEFWYLNQKYRVQLNLFRKYNYGSHNMRTFEIPAVGGIQLTPYSEEQASFFEQNKEIFFFKDDEDMVVQVKKLISSSQEEISQIRTAARKRSMESGYSFKDRSKTVYNVFKNLLEW